MSTWSYSQTGYPRQILYNGDTVIAITRSQMKAINIAHVSWQQSHEINDSLFIILDSCKIAFQLYDSTVFNLQRQVNLQKIAIADRSTVIDKQSSIMKQQDKQIRKLKTSNTILAIATVVLGIIAVGVLIF